MRRRDVKRLIAQSYDHIAEAYLASKASYDPDTYAPLERLLALLPRGAAVLDLGCGAGVPVTQRLAQQCSVTGVDISARQIELAREHVPQAHFLQADMTTLEFPLGTLAAVVSCFAIIHVPREEHAGLVVRVYSWLQPGGLFLATWPMDAWEEVDEDWNGWGAPMWWSHFAPETSLRLLHTAGFTIDRDETRTSNGETWRWVLARKPSDLGEAGHGH